MMMADDGKRVCNRYKDRDTEESAKEFQQFWCRKLKKGEMIERLDNFFADEATHFNYYTFDLFRLV